MTCLCLTMFDQNEVKVFNYSFFIFYQIWLCCLVFKVLVILIVTCLTHLLLIHWKFVSAFALYHTSQREIHVLPIPI